jgi:CRP-like cAMP-binding protein
MQPNEDGLRLSMRALLASAGAPFAEASYERGAVIFSQGDACDSVIYIASGQVRLTVTALDGREAICGLLGAGAFLGEEGIAGVRAARVHTAIVMMPTDVLVIAKDQMTRLLGTERLISDRFLAHVLARQTRLEADLTDQLLHSSQQRLVRALLLLAGCDARHSCRCVLPPVSQEILAEMVGTTRSRVNAFMGKFKKTGFIEADGGALRVNPACLHIVRDACRACVTG